MTDFLPACALLPSPENYAALFMIRREVLLQIRVHQRRADAIADGIDGGGVGIARNQCEADAWVLLDPVDDLALALGRFVEGHLDLTDRTIAIEEEVEVP